LRIPDDPENRLSFNATGSLLGLASAADQATGYVDQFLPHLFSRRCRGALNGADKRPTEARSPSCSGNTVAFGCALTGRDAQPNQAVSCNRYHFLLVHQPVSSAVGSALLSIHGQEAFLCNAPDHPSN
jgi:hypothetical protein